MSPADCHQKEKPEKVSFAWCQPNNVFIYLFLHFHHVFLFVTDRGKWASFSVACREEKKTKTNGFLIYFKLRWLPSQEKAMISTDTLHQILFSSTWQQHLKPNAAYCFQHFNLKHKSGSFVHFKFALFCHMIRGLRPHNSPSNKNKRGHQTPCLWSGTSQGLNSCLISSSLISHFSSTCSVVSMFILIIICSYVQLHANHNDILKQSSMKP